MTPAPRNVAAMAHVKSVPRSIAFYEKLGFTVQSEFTPDGSAEPSWASLACGAGCLMLAVASEPVVPEQQAVLFYLYYDDIAAVHAALTAAGLEPGAISYPFYCPKGEFRLIDPDGYCLMLTHT
jgi:hypothetical protein